MDGRCFTDCEGAACTGTRDHCSEDEFCRPDWQPRPFCDGDEDCEESHESDCAPLVEESRSWYRMKAVRREKQGDDAGKANKGSR